MPNRRRRALGAFLSLFLIAAGAPAPAASLEYVGTFVWSGDDDSFGGFSGIELSEDGSRFHALTDRAHLYWGSIERDSQGVIRAMNTAGRAHLKDSKGRPLPPGFDGPFDVNQVWYEFVANVHDEFQAETNKEFADEFGRLAAESIRRAGEHFGLRCPLAGAYDVGFTWADTH